MPMYSIAARTILLSFGLSLVANIIKGFVTHSNLDPMVTFGVPGVVLGFWIIFRAITPSKWWR